MNILFSIYEGQCSPSADFYPIVDPNVEECLGALGRVGRFGRSNVKKHFIEASCSFFKQVSEN